MSTYDSGAFRYTFADNTQPGEALVVGGEVTNSWSDSIMPMVRKVLQAQPS